MKTSKSKELAQVCLKRSADDALVRSYAKKIAELFYGERAAVFCGAGISFNSGMPVAGQIVNAILAELGVANEEKRALLASAIPFELFMQTLHEHTDITSLFDMFDGGSPNNNHIFLAQLMRGGLVKTVCTTNFDTLIERALAASDMIKERDYLLYESDTKLERIDWSSGLPKLIKIHGTIVNKSEMAITLRQVAAKVLTAGREQVIDRLFQKGSHDTILVFGYSCSDQFDISPRIESYSNSPTRVLLVEHDHDRIADEPIGAKNERNPFRRFRGKRLFVNTDDLVRELWELVLEDPYRLAISVTSDSWQKTIQLWTKKNLRRAVKRNSAISGLLFAAGHPKLGLIRLKSGSAGQAINLEKLVYLINKGVCEGAAGRFDDAIDTLRQALGAAFVINDRGFTAKVLSNLAAAFKCKGQNSTAIKISLEAQRVANAAGNKKTLKTTLACCDDTISSCYHELGNISEAIRYGERALKNFNDSGEVHFATTVLGNLALCQESLGKNEAALTRHIEAYEKSRAVNHVAGSQIHLGNIVRLARDLARNDILEKYRTESAKLLTSAESDHGHAIDLANTASHLSRSGREKEALPLYDEAIRLMRACGDDYGFALQSNNRGLTLFTLKRFAEAAYDFEQCANTYDAVGRPNEQADALVMRAKALAALGSLSESCASLEMALALMQSTNYRGIYSVSIVADELQRLKEEIIQREV